MFNPFMAMLPDSYVLTLVRYQLCEFSFEKNVQETRQNIEKQLHSYFATQGIEYFACLCDSSNNPPTIVQQDKIVVYFEFKATKYNQLSKYNAILGPLTWSKDTVQEFSEIDYVRCLTSAQIEFEKLEDRPWVK